jgi:transcriptional regulator with GAF, ATPase, and Fis domain
MIEIANRKGATTIGFCGSDGGRMVTIVDVCIQVPSQSVEYIENSHQVIEALIARILQEEAQNMPVLRTKVQTSYKPASTDQLNAMSDLPLESIALRRDSERSQTSIELFNELSSELAYQTSLRDILRSVLELTLKRLKASSGTIVVVNERGKPIQGAIAYAGDIVSQVPQEFEQIVQHGLAGWVLQNRKAALIANTRDDPRWFQRPWDVESGRDRSAMCVPLIQEDRIVGVLTLVASQAGVFSDEDLSLLAAVAMFITLVNYAL